MQAYSRVPPGFRFFPTEEELVDYYLRRKVSSKTIDLDIIRDVDLYKIEPWDIQERCGAGMDEQENGWYFFSHKDRKYPTGTRTNRATACGFWKATGRDKPIYTGRSNLVGMRKTLVYYKGRAPNGLKSDWIMHEYRLETNQHAAPQEEGWVVCRMFRKRPVATAQRIGDDPSCWFNGEPSLISASSSLDGVDPREHLQHQDMANQNQLYQGKSGLEFDQAYLMIPQIESSSLQAYIHKNNTEIQTSNFQQELGAESVYTDIKMIGQSAESRTDWQAFDTLATSKLSQDIHDDNSAKIYQLRKLQGATVDGEHDTWIL